MENIYFSSEREANNLIKAIQGNKIGNGCYLISDGYVLKTYDDNYRQSHRCSKEEFLKFKNLDIDGVSFIKWCVFLDNNYVFGTITKYIPGVCGHNNYFREIPIDILIRALERLKLTIKCLSDLGILITDPFDENIIFDGEKFTLTDTGEWIYSEEDHDQLFRQNMISVMYEIYNNIFGFNRLGTVTVDEFLRIINSKYAKAGVENDFLLLDPSTLITGIKTELENHLGINLIRFSDADIHLNEMARIPKK